MAVVKTLLLGAGLKPSITLDALTGEAENKFISSVNIITKRMGWKMVFFMTYLPKNFRQEAAALLKSFRSYPLDAPRCIHASIERMLKIRSFN